MTAGREHVDRRSRRLHAAKVALVATVAVMACYVAGVLAFNHVVSDRMAGDIDARLQTRAIDAARVEPDPGASDRATSDHDHDLDDAPIFVWRVDRRGVATALGAHAPAIGRRTWTPGPWTGEAGGSSFRFYAVRSGTGWIVAGESAAQIQRTEGTLAGPEVLFGGALAVVAFVGSLIIGLRASAPLESVHRRQVEFTADASHELRTPLSVIQAEVDIALSRRRSVEEYEAALRRVDSEGRRLRQIVGDLLWLARADSDHCNDRDADKADLVALATTSEGRFQPVAATNQVSLQLDVAEGPPAIIHADPVWIDRLIGVLVDNACKYAGRLGRVAIRVRSDGGWVMLQVDDSGPGIPPPQRSLVFDRFHRGIDEPGGAGLGLAIADSVVRASGGTWRIGRSPLGGARMEVAWRRAPTRRPGVVRRTVGPGVRDSHEAESRRCAGSDRAKAVSRPGDGRS